MGSYVGIDLHRRRSVIVVLNDDGDRVSWSRIDNTPANLATVPPPASATSSTPDSTRPPSGPAARTSLDRDHSRRLPAQHSTGISIGTRLNEASALPDTISRFRCRGPRTLMRCLTATTATMRQASTTASGCASSSTSAAPSPTSPPRSGARRGPYATALRRHGSSNATRPSASAAATSSRPSPVARRRTRRRHRRTFRHQPVPGRVRLP